MKVTILGCGSSSGVPTITGNWGVCDPKNPKNRRRRPSVLLEKNGFNLLIDTSPDLREQLIDSKCKQIDAVLYTHEHADHVMGIDDLRAIRKELKRNIEVFAAPEVIESLKTRFGNLGNILDFDTLTKENIYVLNRTRRGIAIFLMLLVNQNF